MNREYSSSELLDAVFDQRVGFDNFKQFISNQFNCDVVWDEASNRFFLLAKGQTHPDYWDCEGCEDYHQPSNFKFCPYCGSVQESCSDSLLSELIEHGVISLSDLPDDCFLKI